ncbi:MAG: restriction endonuclease subunit S [Bacteroidales bacterium]|nr:restriction endonuclease subunit S [Bacteroidales bacterium]
MSREMKHSGIPWIGEIPKEWGICRIKNVATLYNGNSIKDEEKDNYTNPANAIPYISTKDIDVTCQSINYENGLYTDISDNTFKVAHADSSLMCIEGGSAGKKKCYVQQDVSFVNKLCCLAPKNINGKYLFYYLCSPNFESEFNKYISGLIGGVSVSILKNIDSILPPLSEQQKIASYLDRKCSEIDEMVVLQEKIIEELKAYKQSVITEAVTKGLNPDVPMKDSGIEWIGEIPEHWEVCFIKQIMRNKSVKGYPDEMVLSLYRDYGVVPKDSRNDNHNVTSDNTSDYKFVEVGDFVINKMKAWQGSMAVSDYQGIISPAYYICRFIYNNVNKRYVHYLLRHESYKAEYMRLSSGMRVGQWDLNIEDFLRTKMILPSLSEQQSIASYLDEKCSEIDSLISIKQSKIESLKEYKKSIIYEYVTGKKEVE